MAGYAPPEKTSISNDNYNAESVGECSDAQNDARTGAEDWHKPDTSGSGGVHDLDTKNPGAREGATGANHESQSSAKGYLERLIGARNLQAAIDACDPALAAIIMDRALDNLRIGEPGASLFNAMDEAVHWASWATPTDHKAYCLASYNAMPPKARASFLSYVQGRATA